MYVTEYSFFRSKTRPDQESYTVHCTHERPSSPFGNSDRRKHSGNLRSSYPRTKEKKRRFFPTTSDETTHLLSGVGPSAPAHGHASPLTPSAAGHSSLVHPPQPGRRPAVVALINATLRYTTSHRSEVSPPFTGDTAAASRDNVLYL